MAVAVGLAVGVVLGVEVGVLVGVAVALGVGVSVGLGVVLGVTDGLGETVGVPVAEAVAVAVADLAVWAMDHHLDASPHGLLSSCLEGGLLRRSADARAASSLSLRLPTAVRMRRYMHVSF